jgi:hypothetical protein
MKAYNHEFTAIDGSVQNIAIADFEDGRFHMFWHGRRWGHRNQAAKAWVRSQASLTNKKGRTSDDDWYSRSARRMRIAPSDLLDYIKKYINDRVTSASYTDDLASDLMALDNRN